MKDFSTKIGLFNLLLLLSIVFLFQSCNSNQSTGNDKPTPSSILPKSYVFGVTEGNISSTSSIQIDFSTDIELINEGGELINEDIFLFNPKIAGKIYSNGKSSLIFKPDSRLKNGKSYKASVDLSKLFNIKKGQNEQFKFEISVIPMQITIKVDELQPYNNKESQDYFLNGRIISSDFIDFDRLKKIVTAKQNDIILDITFFDTDTRDIKKFRVENIIRKSSESKIVLNWNGQAIDSDDEGSIEIPVPSINKFELTNIKVVNSPTQKIVISFSDPIDNKLDMNGIVYLTEKINVKYEIESNKVVMYPDKLQTGDAILEIKKELRNIDGKNLKNDYLKKVRFGQLKPAVKFLEDGEILPGNNDWTIHFQAVNLSKVDVIIRKIFADNVKQFLQVNDLSGRYQLDRVSRIFHKEVLDLNINAEENDGEWNNYSINLNDIIGNDDQGIYRIQIRFKKEYSLYNCDNSDVVDTDDYGYYGYSNYYESDYYYPPGYDWSNRDNPCSVSYFNYDRFIDKNLLASNIGLIVKGDETNGFTVFVNDLITTDVIEGISITLYDFQQQPIKELKTNSNGIAHFKSAKQPWLFVANRGNEFAYVKVAGGNALSYSRFETEGVSPANGISAFIYGDRGVWRPGDTLFLTLIATDVNDNLPENHPLALKLYNPKNKIVIEKTLSTSINGFYSFAVLTASDDLTGLWRAQFTLGESVFNKRIRIENLKPNRLKIDLSFTNRVLTAGNNKASITVNWLHGGIASGLKTEINATLRTSNTVFDDFKDYNFNDVSRYFSPDEVTVLDKNLNKNGKLSFNVKLPDSKRAPGKLKVTFSTKVFEKGGDFSISQKKMIYSPFSTYVGVRLPNYAEGITYYEVGKKHTFNVVTVDANGNPVSVNDLYVEVYKIDWSWWFNNRNNGSSDYVQTDYNNSVYSKTISTVNGKGEFDFEISYPMWGNYYVKVTDPNSGHSCGTKFFMDWPSTYSREDRSAPGDASILSLTSNKKTFNAGDTVKISLPTPLNSKMLVSLESNNRVLKTWWQQTSSTESVIKFVTDKNMAPNIYAMITVIQPFSINNNDLPARMYGVIPILVENKSTVLEPILEVPEEIRPNSKYTIKVNEKTGRKMTYTIAVVDDGLLDITNFRTPDPHSAFYAKQALMVQTWDMYDDVMKAFRGNITRTFAIGGSDMEDESEPEKKKASRFKPVVTFLGPFTLEAGENAKHVVSMSNYMGSVRVMIVAGNEGMYGSAAKTISVRQPLMVLATMPRMLAPDEELLLPVSIFVMDKKMENVKVKITTNENFLVDESEKLVNFKKIGEKICFFNVKVGTQSGVGKVKVEVTSGNETAYNEIEIQIRNPNPRIYHNDNFKVDKGENLIFEPKFDGVEGTNKVSLGVSSMPQINLESRLNYLIRYPYYCIEQTTSSAFPQLFLNEMTSLTDEQKNKVESHISSAIVRISKMQLANGGFGYWPGSTIAADWGTSYAGHFLIKAKKKGYNISNNLLNNWSSFQKYRSNSWSPKYYSNGKAKNDLTQAYRLFTLALAGTPNLAAMNRMREMKGLHVVALYQLASAYAIIGQKSVAKKLIYNTNYKIPVRSYWSSNYGSEIRDKAMMTETLYLLDDDEAIPLVMDIAKDLRSGMWMSTQSTAFSLNAVSLFTQNNSSDDAYAFKYKWGNDWSDVIKPLKPIFESELPIENSDNKKLKLVNTGGADVFVCVTTSGITKLGSIIDEQKNLQLAVVYKDMSGNVIDVSRLEQGLDFYAEIKIINSGRYGSVENMALTQIFPSGWEIINTRIFDVGAELQSDDADFVDFKDDRVNFFFSIGRGVKKKFIVLLNAAYKGRFYMPATKCGDMYNNDVNAVVGGGWVTVE